MIEFIIRIVNTMKNLLVGIFFKKNSFWCRLNTNFLSLLLMILNSINEKIKVLKIFFFKTLIDILKIFIKSTNIKINLTLTIILISYILFYLFDIFLISTQQPIVEYYYNDNSNSNSSILLKELSIKIALFDILTYCLDEGYHDLESNLLIFYFEKYCIFQNYYEFSTKTLTKDLIQKLSFPYFLNSNTLILNLTYSSHIVNHPNLDLLIKCDFLSKVSIFRNPPRNFLNEHFFGNNPNFFFPPKSLLEIHYYHSLKKNGRF